MREQEFVERKEKDWIRLNALTLKAELTPRALSQDELLEAFQLYRSVSNDLSYVQTHSANRDLINFLNNLVLSAYRALYRHPKRSIWGVLHEALATAARTGREFKGFFFASAAILILASIFSFTATAVSPEIRSILGGPMQENTDAWAQGEIPQTTGASGVLATAFYAGNNPRVAIFATAVGLSTLGVGSAYILWVNGVMLGVVGQATFETGRLLWFLTWIFPHGATELQGAFWAGAAGLLLGWALINPGRYSRIDSLKKRGKSALILAAIGITQMYIAAPFEGFFSFNAAVPDILKLMVGLLVTLFWIAFFWGYGRTPEEGTWLGAELFKRLRGKSQTQHPQVAIPAE
jgi:uncharacterized membrane protein SpoIIM required for sporulation